MARPPRIEFAGATYLVTARCLPRQKLHRNDQEVDAFLARLPELGQSLGAVVHGFALLPDHYHLLLETPRGNLSRALHRLHAGYTATINARRRRKGPLLRGRYRSVVIDPQQWLVRLSVHVHLNPLRKGLTSDPWFYRGSSARAYARVPQEIPGVETGRVLELAGGRARYVALLEEAMVHPAPGPWKQEWRGLVLGDAELQRRAETLLAGRDLREIAGFDAGTPTLALEDVLAVVAEGTGVRRDDIVRGKFQRVLARKLGIYLARKHTGLTLREIGHSFGVDYTTVHMAVRRVEQLREQRADVAELLAELEGALVGRAAAGPEPEAPAAPLAKAAAGKGRRRRKEEASPQLKLF